MFTCKFCKEVFTFEKASQAGGHVRNCIANPNRSKGYLAMQEKARKRSSSKHLDSDTRYKANPKYCMGCSKEIEYEKRDNIFCNHSCSAIYNNTKRKSSINVREVVKKQKPPQFKVEWKCPVCTTVLVLNKSEADKRKYCSGRCRNKVNNMIYTGVVSKAEKKLYTRLRSEFPHLEILQNNRKVLNGLELDLYIPSLQIGIEWNGIYHYKKVHRDNSYERIQSSDKKKELLCIELGINLIVVKDLTSNKKQVDRLIEEVVYKIKKCSCSSMD